MEALTTIPTFDLILTLDGSYAEIGRPLSDVERMQAETLIDFCKDLADVLPPSPEPLQVVLGAGSQRARAYLVSSTVLCLDLQVDTNTMDDGATHRRALQAAQDLLQGDRHHRLSKASSSSIRGIL